MLLFEQSLASSNIGELLKSVVAPFQQIGA